MDSKSFAKFGFCTVVLLGAFLLFTLEPLVGKLVTPGFGGTAGVWSACLLFFQLALLVGYFLAYSITRLEPKRQSAVYISIAVLSLLFAFLPQRDAWACHDFQNPALELMLSLTVNLGLPFVVMSSVSVIMQTWYRYSGLGNPYPLYSVSNIGSVLALFSFPVLLEPNLAVSETTRYWSIAYCLLVILMLALSINNWKVGTRDDESEFSEEKSPRIVQYLWWALLSAGGSAVLLSFTTYITQDISPIPLFWILPLGVYLLTFIILFGYPQMYLRRTFAYGWMILWLGELFVSRDDFGLLLAINLTLLFLTCMVFHGEMVVSRPHPRFLPGFYLCMAFGGALGGAFVNFGAPLIFSSYLERQLSLFVLASITIGMVVCKKYMLFSQETLSSKPQLKWLRALNDVLIAALSLLSMVLCAVPLFLPRDAIVAEERNFYSSIQIQEQMVSGVKALSMVHGRVVHGIEYFADKDSERGPGIYWEPVSIAFDLARAQSETGHLKVGVVGLGVGFSAAFGREGDELTFYELDPKVAEMANKYFSYLSRSKADISVSIGDGRLVLEREKPRNFDLLLIDVFNGNAIPVHLLTKEAVTVYLAHLKEDGILAFHVSNRYLDLIPVVGNLARSFKLGTKTVKTESGTYVLLSRNPQVFKRLEELYEKNKELYRRLSISDTVEAPSRKLWTDDYVNLLPYFKDKSAIDGAH